MNILIVDGGVRQGNTWKLTTLVKEELNKLSSEIEFEEIHLKDLELPYCMGCSLCFRKGHQYCPHNKAIQSIMDKIEQCDGLIFTAPTYNMQIPALSKNFIDHMCYMLHRPRYFDKKGLVISTTGGVGAKKATKYVAETLVGWGFNRCYQLPISSISWNAYKPSGQDARKTEFITKKFFWDVASKKLHKPSFSSIFVFNLFRGISTSYTKGTEYETQDGTFWEQDGYRKEIFAPQVPISLGQKLYGRLFYLLGRKMSKKMIVTYKK